MDEFWRGIDAQLDRIEAERPSTWEGLQAILGGSLNAAFFGGSGGDRSLLSALRVDQACHADVLLEVANG